MKRLDNYKLTRRLRELENGGTVHTGAKKNSANAGAASTGVTAVEYGDGVNHITVLTFSGLVVGTPNAGNNLAIGVQIYEFPAGVHKHEVSYANIGLLQGGNDTDQPDVGIGSVIGAGVVALLGGTATFEDYSTGVTWTATCDGTLQAVGPVGATAGILTGISLNKAADEKSVFLNVADGWHAGVTGDLEATGTVVLEWSTIA